MCSGSAKQMKEPKIMVLSLMIGKGILPSLLLSPASLSEVFNPSSVMSFLFDGLLIAYKLPVRLLGGQNELTP